MKRTRRPAVTLTEALMAIFIMAIGLIALLALFPVGAIDMARAIRHDRTAHLAANADNITRLVWKSAWMDRTTDTLFEETYAPTGVYAREPYLRAFDNPWSADPAFGPPWSITPPAFQQYEIPHSSIGASWPVYVDPIGWWGHSGVQRCWVAGMQPALTNAQATTQTGVARRDIATLPMNTPAARIKLLSLTDDIGFSRTGGGRDAGTGQVERGNKYNFALLLQRQQQSMRHECNAHIIVYQDRPVTDLPPVEYSFPSLQMLDNVTSTVRIDYNSPGATPTAGTRPPIKRGGWVMLAATPVMAVDGRPTAFPLCSFHRVVMLEESGSILNLVLERTIGPHFDGGYAARVFILDGVVDVYDRGTVSLTAPPAP